MSDEENNWGSKKLTYYSKNKRENNENLIENFFPSIKNI